MLSFSETLFLYIATWWLTTLLGFGSQTKQYGRGEEIFKFNFYPFLFSFLIHTFVFGFTDIGADYSSYHRIFKYTTINNFADQGEILFYLFGLIVHFFTKNADKTIFFVKTLTLFLFYLSFFLLRKKVGIGFAILAFNVFLFFNSFYLLSMQLNIAFLTLCFALIILNKKLLSFIAYAIAANIHVSSLMLLPVYLTYYIFSITKIKVNSKKLIVILAIWSPVIIYAEKISDYIMSNFLIFDGYTVYEFVANYRGSGVMQYVFFFPLFFFVYLLFSYSKDQRLKRIATCFVIPAFFFALLGYRFEVLARINDSFFGIYAFLIPAYIYNREFDLKQNPARKFFLETSIEKTVWIGYMFFRGYFFVCGRMGEESSALIRYYNFFNPFG